MAAARAASFRRYHRGSMGRMKGRLEAGDLLAFLYALVLVREAFWWTPETAAWGASFGVAALLAVLRLRTRSPKPALPAPFWLGVAAPLGLFWALHLPYPDVGFDALNYHLLHGERALRGLLHVPGDFYPYYFPFLNPAPDILSSLLRWALGYRLGTAGSLLALIWTGALLFRILERAIASPVGRALATLWIVGAEGVLWEVGNYMADLYGLPLLLEAAVLAIGDAESTEDPREGLPLVGLLLGSAVAFKLTNLVFAVPIGIVFLVRLFVVRAPGRSRRLPLALALGAVAFLLPMAPHMLYLWRTTGSPVFPHYNAVFRSPLFPPINIGDGRFGPRTTLEALVWPVTSAFHPERLSELARTSGRLALGCLGALLVPVFRLRDRSLMGLAVIVLLGSILWSFGTGNHRYGLFAELGGGLVLVLLATQGLAAASGKRRALRLLAALPVALLAAQSVLVLWCLKRGDWSDRPTALHAPRTAWSELRRVGSDRDLRRELPPVMKNALPTITGWVDAIPKTSGLMALLAPRLPMIGLRMGFVEMPANRALLDEALEAVRGRRLASLVFHEDLEVARAELARHGFTIRGEYRFKLSYFSDAMRLSVVALELKAPRPRRAVPNTSPLSLGGHRQDDSLVGSIDDPGENAVVHGELFVRGWARTPDEDLAVTVLIDGEAQDPSWLARVGRPDVCTVLPDMKNCATAGYEARIPFSPDDAGVHELTVLFRAADGRYRLYPVRRFTWKPTAP